MHCVSNHFRCTSYKKDRGKLAKPITDGAQHIKNAQHIKKDNDELPLAIVIGARHLKDARHIKKSCVLCKIYEYSELYENVI